MALDTITLKSPYISKEVAEKIRFECICRTGVEIKTGELKYEINTGQLEIPLNQFEITTHSLDGSFSNKISIKVREDEYTKVGIIPSEPYVIIEASVHKAMLNHNVFGGPEDFQKSCDYLIKLVERLIKVKLPIYSDWFAQRIDVSEVYELPSFEAVQEWFKGLNASDYPRRSVTRYGLSGIYASGSTTTLKFYHKGVEFSKHDRPRLKKLWKDDKIKAIQDYANKLIRCECEIKARKLKYDFGHLPTVGDVTTEYINNVHDVEVRRFLKEGVKMMILVSKAQEVNARLREMYSPSLAGILLGTWYKLTTLGEHTVKKEMPDRTWYRQIKQLKEACVTWRGTDVILLDHSLIPKGFSPVRSDSRRLIQESPVIMELYKEYGVA